MRGGEIEAKDRRGDQRGETFVAHGGLRRGAGNCYSLTKPASIDPAAGALRGRFLHAKLSPSTQIGFVMLAEPDAAVRVAAILKQKE